MTTVFTLAEVSKHRDKQDCWLIVDDKVYDVTEFLEDHPGGEGVLLFASGKDATDDFEDVGHSDDARELMSKYLIGSIDITTLPTKDSDTKEARISSAEQSPSEMLIRVLQFLIPLTFLALAIAVQYLSNDPKSPPSSA